MQLSKVVQFFTFTCLLSFASVNAVLFTPALPNIADFFNITDAVAQQTIAWFLPAYAIGQLIYGPFANRYGRKSALYLGIILQIISNLLCVLAGAMELWWLLITGRTLMALGSGVGLTMTFTMINELYESKVAAQKIAYLMIAFAVMPGIAIAIGGYLNQAYGWISCFYAGAIFGFIVLLLVTRLPETARTLNLNAFRISTLLPAYDQAFRNHRLVIGGLLMGMCTTFIYAFATIAPFLAIDLFKMTSVDYGLASLIPPVGMVSGLIVSARLSLHYPLERIIKAGLWITVASVALFILVTWMQLPLIYSLFAPMVLINFALCLIMSNASALAMSPYADKAHGSAVMSFINMGSTTLILALMGFFPVSVMILPLLFVLLCIFMILLAKTLPRSGSANG